MSASPRVSRLERVDRELQTLLTPFDTRYAWNDASMQEGLRDLYDAFEDLDPEQQDRRLGLAD